MAGIIPRNGLAILGLGALGQSGISGLGQATAGNPHPDYHNYVYGIHQQEAHIRLLEEYAAGIFNASFGESLMATPGMSHLGTVKEFRLKFKEYTKAEFREMGSQPVIKEILSGMTKLNKEEIKDRIAEHLAVV